MERSRGKVLIMSIIACLMVLTSCAKSTPGSYRCLLYDSYLEGDMSNWLGWAKEIEKQHPGEFDWIIVSLQARYGLIGYYFGTDQKDKVKPVLSEAEELLERLLDDHPNSAKLLSLQAAFTAYKIGLAKYKAPFLGPRMAALVEQAQQSDPTEPAVWLEKGNSLYNRPEFFGGDKKKAIEAYHKALALFQKEESGCNYLEVLTEIFIVKGYYQTRQLEQYHASRNELENQYGTLPWVDEFIRSSLVD